MRRLAALCVLSLAACSGQSPNAPTAVQPRQSVGLSGSGSVSTSANRPPTLDLRTTPALRDGSVYGKLPLDVGVNLCRSSDADSGDSLRFDVTWGDGVETGPDDPGAGTSVGDGGPPTGCDGTSCCRHRHRFEREGSYTVEVRVSDKHLEDQANGVGAKAISRATFVVEAGRPSPPFCSATGPGVMTTALTVGMPTTRVPEPIPFGATVTSFTSYSAFTVPYVTGTLSVTVGGNYLGTLDTAPTPNAFYILTESFVPSPTLPPTPLSSFIIGGQNGSSTTLGGIRLDADRTYGYLLVFNAANTTLSFRLSGPGGVCLF